MVKTALSTDTQLCDNPEDEPPHSGYSPTSSHSHQLNHSSNHAQPRTDAPTAQYQPELNPNLLRQRLLNTLSPTAGAEVSLSTREAALRSSSAPDLTRAHGQEGVPSPAVPDQGELGKFRRTNSYVVGAPSTVNNATRLSLPDDAAQLHALGHVTPIAPTPRPPLLSKKLLEPKKPVGKEPTFAECLKNTVKYSWLSLLFVFVPVSWAMDLSHQSPTITFVFSFLAIVPCAAMLGFATEELALRVGDALGGLLNATFGNAVELIIAILALVKGELDIVRSSMLGSILSNCLLVLGGCFFAGGIKYHEQGYSVRAAQLNINLLGIAVTAIVVPVAFHYFLEESQRVDLANDSVLRLSRGISFILLFVYASYLVFQLWTHSYLYVPAQPSDPNAAPPTSTAALLLYADGPQPPTEGRVFRLPSWGSSTSASSTRSSLRTTRSRSSSIAHAGAGAAEEGPGATSTGLQENAAFQASDAQAEVIAAQGPAGEGKDLEKGMPLAAGSRAAAHPDEEHEVPKLTVAYAFGLLVVTTAITGVTAEFLVSSIDGLTTSTSINREFVALILLPVVGNAAEHVTAVTVATKNKLDLSIAISVGSSLQIALFVVPILILLAWCIGQPLDLLFDPYETLLVFLCILSVNLAISDGRTQWMEGLSLMAAYVVIALTAWYYNPIAANL
ncbi:hypothetical protein JCM11641_005319 [Rhodosporidiobolus odoratus]